MFKNLTEAETPADMRTAIEVAGFDNPIIHQVLKVARRDAMTPADTYSMLAYYALQSLVQSQRDYLHLMHITPRPQIVMTDGSLAPSA